MVRLQRRRRPDAATPGRFVAVVAVVQHLGVGVVDDDRHVGHLRRRPALLLDREVGRRVRNESHLVCLQRVDGDGEDGNGDLSLAKVVAVVLVVVPEPVAVASAGAISCIETVKSIYY